MPERSVGTPLSMHDPRQVGPWTIHSRLGAGGMGVVFFGTAAGQEAAIKVIRPGLLDAPATRDRFRREVEILRQVRDLHICHYLDADLDAEPAWLAMEYLSGPVLRDQVAEHGPLAEDVWWEVARGIAQALAVLEVHRVTHRDLKPGNVILNQRGPVLIDFGIAHPEDATSLTATGMVTGSPAWLSPEQANLEPTGPATDMFTLGSLLAFAATGRPPFGEGASIAVLTAIATREPDLAGIDEERAALLRRLLAKDPAQRPGARDVLDLARAGTQDGAAPAGDDRRPGSPAAAGAAAVAAEAASEGAGSAVASPADSERTEVLAPPPDASTTRPDLPVVPGDSSAQTQVLSPGGAAAAVPHTPTAATPSPLRRGGRSPAPRPPPRGSPARPAGQGRTPWWVRAWPRQRRPGGRLRDPARASPLRSPAPRPPPRRLPARARFPHRCVRPRGPRPGRHLAGGPSPPHGARARGSGSCWHSSCSLRSPGRCGGPGGRVVTARAATSNPAARPPPRALPRPRPRRPRTSCAPATGCWRRTGWTTPAAAWWCRERCGTGEPARRPRT